MMSNIEFTQIKDLKTGMKNINAVFIVLEVGLPTLTKEAREVRTCVRRPARYCEHRWGNWRVVWWVSAGADAARGGRVGLREPVRVGLAGRAAAAGRHRAPAARLRGLLARRPHALFWENWRTTKGSGTISFLQQEWGKLYGMLASPLRCSYLIPITQALIILGLDVCYVECPALFFILYY